MRGVPDALFAVPNEQILFIALVGTFDYLRSCCLTALARGAEDERRLSGRVLANDLPHFVIEHRVERKARLGGRIAEHMELEWNGSARLTHRKKARIRQSVDHAVQGATRTGIPRRKSGVLPPAIAPHPPCCGHRSGSQHSSATVSVREYAATSQADTREAYFGMVADSAQNRRSATGRVGCGGSFFPAGVGSA
jgi:hypothetical protein